MTQGQVYLVGVLEGCYKIGRSSDAGRRLFGFAPKLPVTLTIHHRINTDNDYWLERLLHAAFSHREALGEWFRLTEDDVEKIKSLVFVTSSGEIPAWLSEMASMNKKSEACRVWRSVINSGQAKTPRLTEEQRRVLVIEVLRLFPEWVTISELEKGIKDAGVKVRRDFVLQVLRETCERKGEGVKGKPCYFRLRADQPQN